nr:MAG TPA: tail protein [Caudoviricetes sp.]
MLRAGIRMRRFRNGRRGELQTRRTHETPVGLRKRQGMENRLQAGLRHGRHRDDVADRHLHPPVRRAAPGQPVHRIRLRRGAVELPGECSRNIGTPAIPETKKIHETGNRPKTRKKFAMIYENKVPPAFAGKVKQIAARLGVNPDHLMAIMWSESRLDPSARNPRGGAVGLIQFMPATAEGLGTTAEKLLKMTGEEQLDYVELFFRPYAARCRTFADLYLACFFPAAIGKPDGYVLQTRRLPARVIARQNPIFDTDGDDRITVGEFRAKLKSLIPDALHPYLF